MTENTNPQADNEPDGEGTTINHNSLIELLAALSGATEGDEPQDQEPQKDERADRIEAMVSELSATDPDCGVIVIDMTRAENMSVLQRYNIDIGKEVKFTREDLVCVLVTTAAELLMEEVPKLLHPFLLSDMLDKLPELTREWIESDPAEEYAKAEQINAEHEAAQQGNTEGADQ